MEIIRDAAWQFVGAILALVVPLLIFFWQRERKELAVGALYYGVLLSVSDEIAKRVRITFDGVEVAHLMFALYAVKNSGNRPILAKDFTRELVINFGTEILSASIARQVPVNLNPSVKYKNDQVIVHPVLLNPGDLIVLKILFAGDGYSPRADTRIVGVTNLVSVESRPKYAEMHLGVFGLYVSLLALDWFGVFNLNFSIAIEIAMISIASYSLALWIRGRLKPSPRTVNIQGI